MSDIKLGQLAPPDGGRDAVHVAVVSVEAGQDLGRAWAVGLHDGKAYVADAEAKGIGVVDPFLYSQGQAYPVQTGQYFWLFLKPGTGGAL